MRLGAAFAGVALALTLGSAAWAATPEQQIHEVLTKSAQAWSAGDLDRFMQSYEHGPATAFVTPEGLLTGHRAIRDRYAARYQVRRPGAMGLLRLDLLSLQVISPTYALATGRYTLAREGRPALTGITTLLFHRSTAGWRIVYDHSS